MVIIHDFITEIEREELLQWVLSVAPGLSREGSGSLCLFDDIERLSAQPPDVYTTIRLRLQERLGVTDEQKEPDYGWFVCVTKSGGIISEHTDPIPWSKPVNHLRCNLFLQVPEMGGNPIVGGNHIPVFNRSIVCFYPNAHLHGCEQVLGALDRVTCSFGYYVPTDTFVLS